MSEHQLPTDMNERMEQLSRAMALAVAALGEGANIIFADQIDRSASACECVAQWFKEQETNCPHPLDVRTKEVADG